MTGSKTLSFNHFGKMGDIIFSLYFCKEFSEYFNKDKFDFHIQTDVEYVPSKIQKASVAEKPVFMSIKSAEFLIPLLRAQPYCELVTYSDYTMKDMIDLNVIRTQPLNYYCGQIRDWYYGLTNLVLPRNFWKKILFVEPNDKFKDKILFTLTERYVNCNIDYKQIEPYKDHLVFIGTEKEHDIFAKSYFDMEYAGQFNNMLQIAQVLQGAKGYIGNQTSIFAVAEGLKIPRGLMACDFIKVDDHIEPGPANVCPLGGYCVGIHKTERLVDAVKNLIKIQ